MEDEVNEKIAIPLQLFQYLGKTFIWSKEINNKNIQNYNIRNDFDPS